MKNVAFVKYTSYGNNFVIVDEITGELLNEQQKQAFAYRATDVPFGIGADNLLVIQRCTTETLAQINADTGYWASPPDADTADFIFRMYEPNGQEALCCGNGLMCIASYLSRRYGIRDARIMTELPLARPNVLTIGAAPDAHSVWADMGQPRPMPADLLAGTERLSDDALTAVNALTVEFRSHDLRPVSDASMLTLFGHVVFTGEPHLVVMLDRGLSLPALGDAIFAPLKARPGQAEKRANFGTWLVDHIGNYINKHYAKYFPAGISVNLVDFDADSGELSYRCFERGINHETLACGTGALAVAYVAKRLGLVDDDAVAVRPHRCNWFQPDAKIIVEQRNGGWTLNGRPQPLLEGVFAFADAPPDAVARPQRQVA